MVKIIYANACTIRINITQHQCKIDNKIKEKTIKKFDQEHSSNDWIGNQ